jgi:hypothetical protein
MLKADLQGQPRNPPCISVSSLCTALRHPAFWTPPHLRFLHRLPVLIRHWHCLLISHPRIHPPRHQHRHTRTPLHSYWPPLHDVSACGILHSVWTTSRRARPLSLPCTITRTSTVLGRTRAFISPLDIIPPRIKWSCTTPSTLTTAAPLVALLASICPSSAYRPCRNLALLSALSPHDSAYQTSACRLILHSPVNRGKRSRSVLLLWQAPCLPLPLVALP